MTDYKLYLGDCLEILPTLAAGSVDVITDPPYGIGTWSSTGGNSISKEQSDAMNDWDRSPTRDQLLQVVNVGRISVVWGGNYFSDILGNCRSPLIWDKGIRGMHFADGEMAWTNFDWGTLRILNLNIANGGTKNHKVHPTQKPVAVMKWSIAQAKTPMDITIFDPYMGSGSTGVAAMQMGYKFIGCEIDPGYYAIAEKRIREAANQPLLFWS